VVNAELALSKNAEKRAEFAGYMQIYRYVNGEKCRKFPLKSSPAIITVHNKKVRKNERKIIVTGDSASMRTGLKSRSNQSNDINSFRFRGECVDNILVNSAQMELWAELTLKLIKEEKMRKKVRKKREKV
jgi:hypothetical protein